jgi:hypothetical protein
MPRAARHFLIVGSFVVLFFVNVAAQVRPDQIGQGGQWLSWSVNERISYVHGFLDGYFGGTYQLCDAARDLFKVKDPSRVSKDAVPGAEASVLCFANRDDYSKGRSGAGLDLSPYTNVITDFYAKHPEYQAVPFGQLMLSLADGKCDTADQLYQRALKGELRRVPVR